MLFELLFTFHENEHLNGWSVPAQIDRSEGQYDPSHLRTRQVLVYRVVWGPEKGCGIFPSEQR